MFTSWSNLFTNSKINRLIIDLLFVIIACAFHVNIPKPPTGVFYYIYIQGLLRHLNSVGADRCYLSSTLNKVLCLLHRCIFCEMPVLFILVEGRAF